MKLNKKTRTLPSVTTSSLPDIIFMLLFFFMVVTVLKTSTEQVAIDIPETEFRKKIKTETNHIYVFIGYVPNSRDMHIQINEKLISSDKIEEAIAMISRSKTLSDKEKIQVHLKADKHAQMKLINDVKKALRRNQIYKLNYLVEVVL